MADPDHCTELTIHFLDGHNESYTVYDAAENGRLVGIHSQLEAMLEKRWWVLQLQDHTILLNLDNVTKIEVRPGVPQIQGGAVLENVDRMSALRRSRTMMSVLTDED